MEHLITRAKCRLQLSARTAIISDRMLLTVYMMLIPLRSDEHHLQSLQKKFAHTQKHHHAKATLTGSGGKALTLTDTPIKEAMELERKQRAEKQPKKRLQKKQLSDSESSDENTDSVPIKSDSEEAEAEPLVFKKGAYVVVKYTSKKSSSMFVGQITALYS